MANQYKYEYQQLNHHLKIIYQLYIMKNLTLNKRSRRGKRKATLSSTHRRKTYKYGGASKVKSAVKDIKIVSKSIMTKLDVDGKFSGLSKKGKKANSPIEIIESIEDVGKAVRDTIDSVETEISSRNNMTKIDSVSNIIISGNSKDVLNSFDSLFSEILDNLTLKIKKNDDILSKFDGDKKSRSDLRRAFDDEKDALRKLKDEFAKKRRQLENLLNDLEPRESVKNNAKISTVESIMVIIGGIQALLLIVSTTTYLSNIVQKIQVPFHFEKKIDKLDEKLTTLNKIMANIDDSYKKLISDKNIHGWSNIAVAGVASITGWVVFSISSRYIFRRMLRESDELEMSVRGYNTESEL